MIQTALRGRTLLPSPCWVSYAPQASIANNKFHWIQTSRENNWFPSAEDLEKKIKSIVRVNCTILCSSEILTHLIKLGPY